MNENTARVLRLLIGCATAVAIIWLLESRI
jgi:hypothetical protein